MTYNARNLNWRFLIVEDNPTIARQLEEECPKFLAPDSTVVDVCTDFKRALPLLDSHVFDILIIDLKDDGVTETEELPGLKIFEEIKKRRFIPVVFYTALPGHVLPKQTAFVRVVEKTAGLIKLREAVHSVFETNLPALSRHLATIQRDYFWNFLSDNWKEVEKDHHKIDLVYLFARRLAQTLQGPSIRAFVATLSKPSDKPPPPGETPQAQVPPEPQPEGELPSGDIHPIELYIYPCSNPSWLAGDIVKGDADLGNCYWIVLTPSCDFEHNKACHVLLAKCQPLTEFDEYKKWSELTGPPSANCLTKIMNLIGDNRSGQRERFKFLPGTYFIPDLVVDFQQLRSVALANIKRESVVASLDSPFAEAVLARFSHYFGRLGTPDIDKSVVLGRLQQDVQPREPAPVATPPPN